MASKLKDFWKGLTAHNGGEKGLSQAVEPGRSASSKAILMEIAPDDPIVEYFQKTPGVAEVARMSLDSPTLQKLKEEGVKLVVPLISQGELIGLLNLGPRMSEQDYSADDRTLLNNLAAQAAPAVRVAQLVNKQKIEAREREHIEQEIRVARLIQQTLLPKQLPDLPGWKVSAYYQPARAVGGDFYDFMFLPDGRLGIFVGDVTDKGVPAALVMATTRSVLRSAANQFIQPGKVLEYANNILYPDIPAKMFITCLYAILNPVTGWMQYANAGHNLPYLCNGTDAQELRATGMPLGLMPDMHYEEKETGLFAGESILLYSDGLTEAHNPQREMYGFSRVKEHICGYSDGDTLIKVLLDDLSDFTGSGWEQEDDVTMVTLHCSYLSPGVNQINHNEPSFLTKFDLESQPGNERLAMEKVCAVIEPLKLSDQRMESLKTAVAEATMNAMEHGNLYQKDKPVTIEVIATEHVLSIRVTDHGGNQPIPDMVVPDLEAKLAGLQSPRGWGLFLIQKMVDEMHISSDETHHTVELVFYLQEDGNDVETPHY